MADEITIKIKKTIKHTGRQRPWGYEIPATFVDEQDQEHNVVLLFRCQGEPKHQDITDAEASQIAKLEIDVADDVPDEMISRKMVEAVLASKGYLAAGQTWEDLPAKGIQ